jgi:hypothetical protein
MIVSHLEIIAKGKFLAMVKLLSQLNILFLNFFLLNCWTAICCPFHNFVLCDGSFTFKGVLRGKLYLMDFVPKEVVLDMCLISKRNMGWLWHHGLAYVGMRNLQKLQKDGHILGLTNIVFEKDRPCRACQAGKQVGAPHHTKKIMTTTRPLEMLHMDLFGPIT